MSKEENKIIDINFDKAISDRYLSYALSTITSRSLPDVRDGLKPVHRRLLWAMLKLKLDPNSSYKKCARVVGDVIGKYHPHGDTAVYDTLVRLAQSFSLRYPLVDGQGNFGSIDGDNAAAMRYTESKLTNICMLLMQDIDKDTVDFIPTYDDSDFEPNLMPASFPNLLANGSEGIAVGMATSIPPHNLYELCEALLHLIDNENSTTNEIMNFIKGPDFPTGGLVTNSIESIREFYNTGKGGFKVRAKWEKESFSHGLYHIVIKEIPYQVQKSKLIEQIAELMKNKKLPLIGNIRDESDENIRIIIEPKVRTYTPEVVMESLFKLSMLESRVQMNMNVLDSNGTPRVMNIVEVLQEFIKHRTNIITRRTNFELEKIANRLEILEALKVVYLNVDEIITIIREEDNPKSVIISRFKLNETQAEAILNLKLRSLRKLEEQQINDEHDELVLKQAELNKILSSPAKLKQLMKKELKNIQKKFSLDDLLGKRKTNFQEVKDNDTVVDISAFIEKEPVTVICSKMGWIRSMRGHNLDLENIKYKEGDSQAFIIETYTTGNIIVCSNHGKFFTILADNIAKGKGHGESIRLMIDIGNSDIVDIFSYIPQQKFLLASDNGKAFIVNIDDVIAYTKSGKQVMNLDSDSECKKCILINGDMVAVISNSRKLLVCDLSELPEMKRGKGVTLQKYRNAKLSDLKIFNSEEGLSWELGSKTRVEKNILSWRAKRGAMGKLPPTGFPRNNKFS